MQKHDPPTSLARHAQDRRLDHVAQATSESGRTGVSSQIVPGLEHAPPVRAFLLQRLGNLDHAEDAAQETFVRAWSARASLASPERLVSWLLGIAANVAAQFVRDAARRHKRVARHAAMLPAKSSRADNTHDAADLARNVESLPDPYRRVILLRYWSGMTCREIAAASGTPVGSVTKQLSRGHAMLRASMNTPLAPMQTPEPNATPSPGRASGRVHTNQGAIDGMQPDT